ncbi:MAG: DUF5908 family protein [Burkholderiales bacterium]
MTIEVRQMVIRSSVDTRKEGAAPAAGEPSVEVLEQMKAEILAQCRELLREKLRDRDER